MLPIEARRLLQKAAEVPNERDPLARIKAIEAATAKLRREYPEFFREESDDVQTPYRD